MAPESPQPSETPTLADRRQWVVRPKAPEAEATSVLFSHYLWVIWHQAWKIALFVLAATALAYFVSKRIVPVYESTATIDIDRRTPNGVVGAAAQQAAPSDSEQFIATQVRLMQSASVLRPVAEQFHLSGNNTAQDKGAVSVPGLKVTHVPGTYIVLITYRSSNPETAASIANGVAESYIRHNYDMRMNSTNGLSKFMGSQIAELRSKMESSSAAVADFSRQLNFVAPDEKANVLTSRLLQTNTEYINAQNERVKKQAALNAVRAGALEGAQASSQGEATRKLADRLDDAQRKFGEVAAVYGKKHPEYLKAEAEVASLRQALQNSNMNTLKRVGVEYQEALNREQMLRLSVDDLKAQVDSLSTTAAQYQSKQREADSDRRLYEELMQRIKEAGINAGFDNNSVRLADPAQPAYTPVSPNLRNNVIVALLLSLFFSIGAAILTDTMDNTVRDPDSIAQVPGAEVIGMLPLVRDWKSGATEFDEALRSMRNSILLSGTGERPHSILFTSAAPDEGKTTAAVHLALIHAMQGKRTLLLDADLRRPGTKQLLGYDSTTGISDVIANGSPWQAAVTHMDVHPDLDILPAGAPSPTVAALVERVIPTILREARGEYDMVIIDAPPMLGFSEALQIAAIVDRVVIITRVGQTNRKSVAVMLKTLERLRARVSGIVLNGANRELSDRYVYHGTYSAYQKHYGQRRIA